MLSLCFYSCSACSGSQYQSGGRCFNVSTCGVGFEQSAAATVTSDRQVCPCLRDLTRQANMPAKHVLLPVAFKALLNEPAPTFRLSFLHTSRFGCTFFLFRQCVSCVAGKFKNSSSLVSCSAWSSCPAGTYIATEGSTSTDRVCRSCQAGTSYSDTANLDACNFVTVCDPGTAESRRPTVSSDRECRPCDGITQYQNEVRLLSWNFFSGEKGKGKGRRPQHLCQGATDT